MSKVKTLTALILTATASVGLGLGVFSFARAPVSAFAVDGYDDVNTAEELISAVETGTENIRLTDNIQLSSTVEVNRTLSLDLNGYILKYNGQTSGSVITVLSGDFTVEDNSSVRVHNYYTIDDNGLYTFDSSLTAVPENGGRVTGGVITGGLGATCELEYGGEATYGGGIYMAGGTLTITGGTIAGNTANFGGGVFGTNTINLRGGEVVGNTATGSSASCAGGIGTTAGTVVKASGSVIVDNNKAVHGENITSNNLYLNLNQTLSIDGELKNGATIAISQAPSDTSDPSSGFDDASSFLTGFATNNPNKNVGDYIKSDYLHEEAGKTYEAVTDEDGNIVWKEYTLVKKPTTTYKEIRYTGDVEYSAVLSAITGADIANDDIEQVGTHYIEIDLADGGENTRWEDGTKEPIIFTLKILPMLIDKPTADETLFDYNGEEQTYFIPENNYYTVEGATQTEAGTHTVTVTLNNPNVAWNDEAETTAALTFDFVIKGPTELSLLGLVIVLAIVLVIEVMATGIYWANRRRKEEALMFHYFEPKSGGKGHDYRDKQITANDSSDHDRYTTHASSGLVFISMLAVFVPTWEVVLIVLLTTAIILVAVYNIYLYTRHKTPTKQESTGTGYHPVPEHHENQYYHERVYTETPVTPPQHDYTPYIPPHFENTDELGELIKADDSTGMDVMRDSDDMVADSYYADGAQENKDKEEEDIFSKMFRLVDIPPQQEEEKAEESQPAVVYAAEPQDDHDSGLWDAEEREDEACATIPPEAIEAEHVQIMDGNGEVAEVLESIDEANRMVYVTKYRKSFTARLIQSWDESKEYYSDLKNEVLGYKNVKSEVSWDYDNITKGGKPIIRFDIRGKTLCMYFALDPDGYQDSRYKVERTRLSKFADVPCLYRIKNPTRAKNAVELMEVVCKKNGAVRGRKQHKDYTMPYETTPPLVERDLATTYIAQESYDDFLKRSGRSEEELRLANAMHKAAFTKEEKPSVVFDDEDIVEEKVLDRATGKEVIRRYNKSFTAKIIQATDETKSFYNSLKNDILSYERTKSTVWWNCDSIHVGNKTVAKFAIHDDVLCLYLALKPADYEGTEYQVEAAVGKRNVHVPCMYRVKNGKRERLAKDLIAELAMKCGLNRGIKSKENFFSPYESTENLLRRGLIKEIGAKEMVTAQTKKLTKEQRDNMYRECLREAEKLRREVVSALDVNNLMDDEVAVTLVEDKRNSKSYLGKTDIVNVDKISAAFNAGDIVNLKTLKQKGLVADSCCGVKILARGTLTKPLTVEASDYSIEAIKMILLTGGSVKRI